MWKYRRVAYLILFGAAAIAVGIYVTLNGHDGDERLLAVVCVIGGLAMIVVALDWGTNGGGDRDDDS